MLSFYKAFEGSPFFVNVSLNFPVTLIDLVLMFLCGEALGFFTCLMDSFLETFPMISGVKLIREVEEFLTEAPLDMIALAESFKHAILNLFLGSFFVYVIFGMIQTDMMELIR